METVHGHNQLRKSGWMILGSLFRRNDFPAFVRAAIRANAVGHLRLAALRTNRHGRLFQEIVRPAGIASRLGMSFYWIWHGKYPSLK